MFRECSCGEVRNGLYCSLSLSLDRTIKFVLELKGERGTAGRDKGELGIVGVLSLLIFGVREGRETDRIKGPAV